MQRIRPRRSRFRAILTLVVILAVIGALIWGGITLFAPKSTNVVVASKLPCQLNSSIMAFGENVLYYDGVNIHCMSGTGTVRWSFPIGSDAEYHCNSQVIVAWAGSTIYILDQNGNSSYNDNLGEAIQFARAGSQYVAIVIGDTAKPRLIVRDHTGAHMDEESELYTSHIILDVGFYGKSGEYMWTLALDVYGTAANTILNTFEVGKMYTGEVSLGDSITYGVVCENSKIRVIGTRNMKTLNYRGAEEATQSVLVYGWYMIAHEVPERGDAQLLFAPTTQTENHFDIREMRLISGSIDRRYSLPDTCIGGVMWRKTLYAISPSAIYRAGMSDSRFTEYEMPLPAEATRFIDITTDGRAIVACGDEVYTITLPIES